MAKHSLSLRISKFVDNRLLNRKQMVVTIVRDGEKTMEKKVLREELAKIFKVESSLVSVFGLKTAFGGGKTVGFALIYDDAKSYQKIEPKYRQQRLVESTGEVVKISRKQRKERKNRAKKTRGTKPTTKKSKK